MAFPGPPGLCPPSPPSTVHRPPSTPRRGPARSLFGVRLPRRHTTHIFAPRSARIRGTAPRIPRNRSRPSARRLLARLEPRSDGAATCLPICPSTASLGDSHLTADGLRSAMFGNHSTGRRTPPAPALSGRGCGPQCLPVSRASARLPADHPPHEQHEQHGDMCDSRPRSQPPPKPQPPSLLDVVLAGCSTPSSPSHLPVARDLGIPFRLTALSARELS